MKQVALILFLFFFAARVWAQEETPSPTEEKPPEEVEAPAESPTEAPVDEKVDTRVQEAVDKLAGEARGDMEDGPFLVRMEGAVTLNYVFSESPDSFLVTYTFKLDEVVRNRVDVRKGNLESAAIAKGFLAKWPNGECNLKISNSTVPYELIFNRTKPTEARVDFKLKDSILEVWESLCNFADAPGSKFNTRGNPEKWLDAALKKTSPALRQLTLPLRPGEPTSSVFKIEKYQAPDLPVGTVEIEGAGTVSVEWPR